MESNEFICFLEPARVLMPDDPTAEESAAVEQHFAYYKRLHSEGKLVLAGRTQRSPHIGIMIFHASDESHAQAIVNNDPAVSSGVFRARVQLYRIALGIQAPSTPQWTPGAASLTKNPIEDETRRYRTLASITLLFVSLIALANTAQSIFSLCMSIFVWDSFWVENARAATVIRLSSLTLWISTSIFSIVLWVSSMRSDNRPKMWGVITSLALTLFCVTSITLAWAIRSFLQMR